MRQDIESYLHLTRCRDCLKDMPEFDKKPEAAAEMILSDKSLETSGGKALGFTEYTATTEYRK